MLTSLFRIPYLMKITIGLATLLLACATAHAQLVKTLFQTFELPDSATLISFQVYQEDAFEVIPWAGNTVMTESNIKLYYASRAVFDHLLEKGRYNFESRENGDTVVLKAVNERLLKVKLNTDEEAHAGKQKKNEVVSIRIFIPDGFTQASPTIWARPREEKSEERLGAYRPRKKLAREAGSVSDELKEAIPEIPQDTVQEQLILPNLDSIRQRQQQEAPGKPKND